jgi:hypothetical protein
MNPSGAMLPKDGPATYQVRVQGILDSQWSDLLGGMNITTDYRVDAQPVTILTGRLPDQSALAGVLSALHDLGLSLLSVERLSQG